MRKRTESDDKIEQERLARFNDPDAGDSPIVDWLLNAPEKNFFAPIESESTDILNSPPAIKRKHRK